MPFCQQHPQRLHGKRPDTSTPFKSTSGHLILADGHVMLPHWTKSCDRKRRERECAYVSNKTDTAFTRLQGEQSAILAANYANEDTTPTSNLSSSVFLLNDRNAVKFGGQSCANAFQLCYSTNNSRNPLRQQTHYLPYNADLQCIETSSYSQLPIQQMPTHVPQVLHQLDITKCCLHLLSLLL